MTPLCAWLRVLTSESGILLATDGASYQQREWVRQVIEAMRDALAALDAQGPAPSDHDCTDKGCHFPAECQAAREELRGAVPGPAEAK